MTDAKEPRYSLAPVEDSDRGEMNDMIAFLHTRADCDEQRARLALEAISERWDWELIAQQLAVCCDTVPNALRVTQHLHYYADPRRTLAEVEVIRQLIRDYRAADGALLQADDYYDPSWATIRAGRNAFKSVLKTWAKAAGWEAE